MMGGKRHIYYFILFHFDGIVLYKSLRYISFKGWLKNHFYNPKIILPLSAALTQIHNFRFVCLPLKH